MERVLGGVAVGFRVFTIVLLLLVFYYYFFLSILYAPKYKYII